MPRSKWRGEQQKYVANGWQVAMPGSLENQVAKQ